MTEDEQVAIQRMARAKGISIDAAQRFYAALPEARRYALSAEEARQKKERLRGEALQAAADEKFLKALRLQREARATAKAHYLAGEIRRLHMFYGVPLKPLDEFVLKLMERGKNA